ncbi:MAG: hypothetical protein Q7T87_03590 [Polaromonas sp.]|nr:hypothetical protein [Polaromonas sp.]
MLPGRAIAVTGVGCGITGADAAASGGSALSPASLVVAAAVDVVLSGVLLADPLAARLSSARGVWAVSGRVSAAAGGAGWGGLTGRGRGLTGAAAGFWGGGLTTGGGGGGASVRIAKLGAGVGASSGASPNRAGICRNNSTWVARTSSARTMSVRQGGAVRRVSGGSPA